MKGFYRNGCSNFLANTLLSMYIHKTIRLTEVYMHTYAHSTIHTHMHVCTQDHEAAEK